jgi:hypothetical protein
MRRLSRNVPPKHPFHFHLSTRRLHLWPLGDWRAHSQRRAGISKGGIWQKIWIVPLTAIAPYQDG